MSIINNNKLVNHFYVKTCVHQFTTKEAFLKLLNVTS
jgi:hypothetical protein